jgi:hypothetical protein
MCHSAIALRVAQANSSNVHGRLWLGETAPEPNPYRRNLWNPEKLQLSPTLLNMQSGVSPRAFLEILAVTERHGLIAKKSPPRLPRPPALSRHVARHGCLGDAETEHQKFTMDPRRTPEKVLTGHPYDQTGDFAGNPRAPAAPTPPGSISPKR